jgi:RimJ/RimL family protein N-acetyltransferase
MEPHDLNQDPDSQIEDLELDPLPNWPGNDYPLVCRELKKTDSKLLFPVMKANAKHLKGYIGWAKYAPSWDFKEVQRFVNDHVNDELPRFHLLFSIGYEVVGFGSLAPVANPRDIQVALWVSKDFEGQGIGRWIVTQLEWYAFYVYGYDNVYYQHDASNRRSGKLPSILGYDFVRSFDEAITAKKETGLWYSWRKKKPTGITPGLIDTGTLDNWNGVQFPWVSLI